MNPFNQKKIWKGILVYKKGYGNFQNEKLEFEFQITQFANDYFEAISKDIAGFGINPSDAKITGTIRNNTINFEKIYNQNLYFDKYANFHLEEKKSIPIIYEGKYHPQENKFHGKWKIHVNYKILWIIPYKYKLQGIWTME